MELLNARAPQSLTEARRHRGRHHRCRAHRRRPEGVSALPWQLPQLLQRADGVLTAHGPAAVLLPP
jgi:hypothetical protein